MKTVCREVNKIGAWGDVKWDVENRKHGPRDSTLFNQQNRKGKRDDEP